PPYATRAFADRSADAVASAAAHYGRAIALLPENPALHLSLFRFALLQRPGLLDLALRAARDGVARDRSMLGRVLSEVPPIGLTDAQWLALVPESSAVRLHAALGLETRAVLGPAT